jgi:energy-coupling factor transporter transmembrane protein EcfT
MKDLLMFIGGVFLLPIVTYIIFGLIALIISALSYLVKKVKFLRFLIYYSIVGSIFFFFGYSIWNSFKISPPNMEGNYFYEDLPSEYGPGVDNDIGGPGSHNVNGYFRKDGTYVSPHIRSNPDGSQINNFSK